MKHDVSLWVVVPAYNEASRIVRVLTDIKKYATNIVVVDDGSKDDTYAVSTKTGVTVLRQELNLGKGAALKTGCDYVLTKGAKHIIVIDSDGQHEPVEIPKFVDALKKNDVVFGYRSFSKKMPPIFRFGNWFINQVIAVLYGVSLHDTQCGYRAFTADAYQKVRWEATDYSMESEMIANTGKHNLSYKQIKIKTIYADRYKGTTVWDGIKIVYNMIIWRLKK